MKLTVKFSRGSAGVEGGVEGGVGWGVRNFLYGAVQRCAAGIGILLKPEII